MQPHAGPKGDSETPAPFARCFTREIAVSAALAATLRSPCHGDVDFFPFLFF